MLRIMQKNMRPSGLEKLMSNFRKCFKYTEVTATKNQEATIDLPESAEVVIIGGGIVGCSTLYHLAKRGVQAILLERDKLTSGTTWHTGGLLWTLRPDDVQIKLLQSTRNLLISLKDETGIDPGWINNGGLYVAHTQERLNEYKRLATIGRSFHIDARIVDPGEAQAVFPLLNPDVIVGGLYNPMDGCIDPNSMINALTRSAKKNGAKVKLFP